MNTVFSGPEHCSHPMVRSQYVLDTDPMDLLLKQIAKWINLRLPGAYASAPTRFGKTRAAMFAASGAASDVLPSVPIFLVICKRHNTCSEIEFLSEILRGIGHQFDKATSRSALRERVVNFLAVCAASCGQRQVVLLCDEAQNNHVPEYHTLCTIQNELNRLSILLTVISIGSPELSGIHNTLIKGHETYLAARFLLRNVRFRGIESESQLRFVLRQYDLGSEWPEGSGLSYTKYFFPGSFADGFRVEELTPYMWQEFIKETRTLDKLPFEVPMEYIAHSVEEVFRTFPDAQVAEQRRDERDRSELSRSIETILKDLAFHEYMNGLVYDLSGVSR